MRAQIEGETLSLVVERDEDGCAHLVWFGPKAQAEMASPAGFQRLPASPDVPVGPTLLPEHGHGFHGIAQLEAHCAHSRRRVRLGTPEISEHAGSMSVEAADAALGVHVQTTLCFSGDALIVRTRLSHRGNAPLELTRLASALLPAPDWASRVHTHAGAWGREGHPVARDWSTGRVEQLGRSGRPGFDGGPTLSLLDDRASALTGRWLTVHLAWSGPFRLAAERATDGSAQVLAERLFAPGEAQLVPGEALEMPDAILAMSQAGSNGVSRVFRAAIRDRMRTSKRLVHFNTWEARYLDVTEAECIALVGEAARLGAERFVLDDGWFKGRRNDETSLGDWIVDDDRFPNGLTPLIDATRAQGMEFGLWLEPEMVSPDSDLYRAHPDWVLGYPDSDLATGRNQLVLDLALEVVRDHLFDALSALLDAYPISYLKWDCNRDLYSATRDGVARPGAQTEGVYALLDRLRAAYPVEIESCASGGGRIDAGIAKRCDRFWTSDATDAGHRLRIQRAAGLIMPPEVLGAHVGPSPNPMTGRQIPMGFRVLSALFGHFGIEADPGQFTSTETAILKRGIELYKTHRNWMHTAQLVCVSEPGDDLDVQLLMAADGGQAFTRLMRIDTPMRPLQPRVRLAGLDPDARYTLTEIALEGELVRWPLGEFAGLGLMEQGLSLDPGQALTGRLIHLERKS